MFRNPRRIFVLLFLLTIFLVLIDLPENYRLQFTLFERKVDRIIHPLFDVKTSLGLDLAGGSHVVLEADMKDITPLDRKAALESAKEVIERRVNFFGVSEPIVQTAVAENSYRIIVELPGVNDVEHAIRLIGQTALLDFREFEKSEDATPGARIFPTFVNTKSVGLTGKELKNASLTFSQQTGEPEVAIEFTSQGAKIFSDVTGRLVGKVLAIFLDDLPLTAPVVQTAITDGRAVITGSFTRDTAKTLALQLNAGALPISVKPVEQRTVGATLGAESVEKSIRAGMIGLGLVALFMILLYGRLGIIADAALVLYGLLTFAIFRIFGITLTLPGIAGFLLSIGMAVDSNILIFERYKEELRMGKPWLIAIEQAFGKAWDSIRDANFTTIITSLILYNPGNWSFLPASGMVRGFAATLLIGVVTSLFTGLIVSRNFIRVFYKEHSKQT